MVWHEKSNGVTEWVSQLYRSFPSKNTDTNFIIKSSFIHTILLYNTQISNEWSFLDKNSSRSMFTNFFATSQGAHFWFWFWAVWLNNSFSSFIDRNCSCCCCYWLVIISGQIESESCSPSVSWCCCFIHHRIVRDNCSSWSIMAHSWATQPWWGDIWSYTGQLLPCGGGMDGSSEFEKSSEVSPSKYSAGISFRSSDEAKVAMFSCSCE